MTNFKILSGRLMDLLIDGKLSGVGSVIIRLISDGLVTVGLPPSSPPPTPVPHLLLPHRKQFSIYVVPKLI
jgi:hypothetical protein